MLSDQDYMELAIALARQGVEGGHGGPFGAVVVKDGEVIGQGHNSVLSKADPTAHAEVVAIREACSNLGHFQLEGCTLYTSCEPCPMCLGAIYWARPERVVYACTREDAKEAGFDDDFIYQELELPLSARSIPMEQRSRAEALQAMQAWREKEDKTPY